MLLLNHRFCFIHCTKKNCFQETQKRSTYHKVTRNEVPKQFYGLTRLSNVDH